MVDIVLEKARFQSFLPLLFCLSAVVLPVNSISDRILSIRF